MTSPAPMELRVADLHAFVCEQLGPGRARLLEVGCGGGELALALAADGHEVTAIDPRAPEGPIFERVALEEFDGEGPFDAVVASVSLHHVHDLPGGLDRIAGLLRPGGLVVVEEFATERLHGATARWYHRQRQAIAALGRDQPPVEDTFEAWHERWWSSHPDLHPAADVHRELAARFAERLFEWRPYLYSYALDDAIEPLERRLIETGEIEATGARFVGVREAPR